jgi:hypothetical protein
MLNTDDGTVLTFIADTTGSVLTYGTFSNHPVAFKTNNSERARIDSSGRLLVGTSTAVSTINYAGADRTPRLQVSGGSADDGSAAIIRTDTGPALFFGSGASGTNLAIDNNVGVINFNGWHTSKYYEGARIAAITDATPGAGDMPCRLVFSTTADGASSPTPRAQIDSVGRAFFFSSGNGILSTTTAAAGTTTTLFSGNHSSGGGFTGGSASVYIWSNGNVQNTNNSYGAISDLKLKENIVDANSQWDDLKALQVRNYNFKEGQTHTQIGLVAQEAELVSPGLVSESPDRDEEGNDLGTVTKAVNYSVLYMKAVKALQEAMERIEALEADVAALKGA